MVSGFDTSWNKLTFSEKGDYVEAINGKAFWGSDGWIPKTRIAKMVFRKNDLSKVIPAQHYDDLFEPNIKCYEISENEKSCYTNGYVTNIGETIIEMSNSDGAGAYVVIFIFDEMGKLKARVVGHGF